MRPVSPKDWVDINGWLGKRALGEIRIKDFPKIGLIEPGVAVGFLVSAESGICFVEAVITNPEAPLKKRRETVQKIAASLIERAKDWGFERCIILSNKKSLLRIAVELGFKSSNKVVMSKEV